MLPASVTSACVNHVSATGVRKGPNASTSRRQFCRPTLSTQIAFSKFQLGGSSALPSRRHCAKTKSVVSNGLILTRTKRCSLSGIARLRGERARITSAFLCSTLRAMTPVRSSKSNACAGNSSGRIFPYNGRSVGTAFRRQCRALKIDDLHFHDLGTKAQAASSKLAFPLNRSHS